MKWLLFILTISLSLLVHAGDHEAKVIYGEDNRMDIYETANPQYIELAKSTAAQIQNTNLIRTAKHGEDYFKVMGQTLLQIGLCPTEKYSHQVAGAHCSGFIIAKDLLVTAGNCIRDIEDCSKYSWVFDYKVTSSNDSTVTIPASNIFRCKEIIARSQDDYALVRLDRSVKGRAPLSFRKEGIIANDAKIFTIGHPIGLPAKIADNAKVRNNQSNRFFISDLDTYGGNSGSAVFSSETLEVEGIFVRGEDDFIFNPQTNCSESRVCASEACRGEDVARITNFKQLNFLKRQKL